MLFFVKKSSHNINETCIENSNVYINIYAGLRVKVTKVRSALCLLILSLVTFALTYYTVILKNGILFNITNASWFFLILILLEREKKTFCRIKTQTILQNTDTYDTGKLIYYLKSSSDMLSFKQKNLVIQYVFVYVAEVKLDDWKINKI